ncbi:MAG TPA: choline dehydrogenase [Alphaproteobacteria bacterium]|nr:choline dehydrogenase [Alphaproteobacteria bacterium]
MEETYDFVIVGAGSAGCVLANRLTADGRNSVLLLEAGPRDTNPWIHIPLGYGRLFVDSKINWGYSSEPEPHLNGRRIYNPRGKVLGGSSSINGLIYIRGQPEDFDEWRAGNRGWSWADVLPYFKRAEDQARGADEWHGTGGPLSVEDCCEPHPLCEAFIDAAEQAGFPRNPDFNGATQEGAGYFQLTSRRGRRCSAAVAYLRPAMRRPNLRVVTEAVTSRVLFDGRTASGVEYRARGALMTAKARREVIVAAGALATPPLLQRSGVGPADLLKRLGVTPVLAHEGVGRNYHDHLQVRVALRCTQKITLNDDMVSLGRKLAMGLRYALLRKGMLTIGAGYAGGFFRTPLAEDHRPDIQSHFLVFSLDKMGEALHPFSGFTASSCQLRPESRGEVMAVSPDPEAPPSIRANFLSSEKDRRVNVEGLKLIRRILAAPAMQRFIAQEHEPGEHVRSDDEILAYCRERGSTIYHPSGTCKMGDDPLAVVDHRLAVRGLERLRVVDASVMPQVPSGNTNAAVIMIAEKASDMILGAA